MLTRVTTWLAWGVVLGGLVPLQTGCAGNLDFAVSPASSGAVLVAAAEGAVGSDANPEVGSAYGSYLAGLYAGQQRDLSVAADFMLSALADDPDNIQLLNRTFMLVAGDGRQAKAAELAHRLREVDPAHSIAALVLAVEAVQKGAYDDADSFLAELPDRGLSTVTVPLLRGWLSVVKGDIAAALNHAAPLKKKNGFGVFHGLHVALMHDVAGQIEEARAAYEETLKLAGQPTLRLAWVAGNFFERNGQANRAADIYRDFLEKNPDSMMMGEALARIAASEIPAPTITGPLEGMAESLFNLASLLSRERAEEVALIHAHLALWLKPKFDIAWVLLGEVLQAQDRGRDAIAAYRRISATSPFSWMIGLRVAEELDRLGMVDEAVAELEKLAVAQSDRFEPLLRLGNLLRGKERFEEAVSAYDRAEARLRAPERRHWTLYYFRGISLERLSQWKRAEKDFLFALELEPEQPFVMNYLAYTWIEKKLHLDKAKGMLVRAVELRPDDGYIVDSLGWVYYRLGEYIKGVTYLERAVELRPQDSVINDHLGDVYWRVGRRQEARFQWRRALSLKPAEDEALKIETKIERGLIAPPEKI